MRKKVFKNNMQLVAVVVPLHPVALAARAPAAAFLPPLQPQARPSLPWWHPPPSPAAAAAAPACGDAAGGAVVVVAAAVVVASSPRALPPPPGSATVSAGRLRGYPVSPPTQLLRPPPGGRYKGAQECSKPGKHS